MSQPTADDLLMIVADLRQRLDHLERKIKQVRPQKQWYTRGEFAQKQGLKPQTVSNYLYQGKYGAHQRKKSGRWQIHESELNN